MEFLRGQPLRPPPLAQGEQALIDLGDRSNMLGVCYYPEHWPRSRWREDAAMMAGLGLTYVRIGEFAWSRLEPRPGDLQFDWLDEAVNALCAAGLQVVMGTPTATPPKWLVDRWPEVLPVDPHTGRTRGFGSRRHYDFSSRVYLEEALRIVEAMARRYGPHPGVAGWQTDNELCCHDTALSGSAAAREAFQAWCAERYRDIESLNSAWGNVFWSMEYSDFAAIELPIGAVTETNPAHRLAYRRFSSDQVVRFHSRMVAAIRRHAPGKFVTHNFIPMSDTGIDNFALAAPLDFSSYDNYPLGRTDLHDADAAAQDARQYMRTGRPDFATYYHDQTRGLSEAGFWVMEQQPGPVNWAANNPRPAPGMIRLWTLEAFAHGADCVCYFRWRQAPFAQEQMHAGLLRPDNSKTEAWDQARQARDEVLRLDVLSQPLAPAPAAIVTGADGFWVSDIERQGQAYDANRVQLAYYGALRELGVNVDFVAVDADLSPYALVIAPSLPILDEDFVERCRRVSAALIFGPRAGAKTDEFGYPASLPPGALQALIPLRVLSVETLRADCPEKLIWEGRPYQSGVWREQLDAADCEVLAHYEDGTPAVLSRGRIVYIATLTCAQFLRDFLRRQCRQAGIETYEFGQDIRVCRRGELLFAFNYADRARELPLPADAQILLGSRRVGARDITVWRARD